MEKIDFREMKWIHQPKLYICDEERLTVETEPYTDWRVSATGGLGALISYPLADHFVFTVRTEFVYHMPFDQCGLILYNGDVQKAVICTEKKDDEYLRLCANVFHQDGGDRSMRDVGAALAQIIYRVYYRAGSCRVQYSFTGERFTDLREFYVDPKTGITSVCLYACSPANSYCDCTFFDFNIMNNDKMNEEANKK